jgi:hypothetical protein
MYTAIVLYPSDRERLFDCFYSQPVGDTVPCDWVKKGDHVTINMGKISPEWNDVRVLGRKCSFYLSRMYVAPTHGIIAVSIGGMWANNHESTVGPDQVIVDHTDTPMHEQHNVIDNEEGTYGLTSINKVPHITLFHAPNVKPVKSNEVLESASLTPESKNDIHTHIWKPHQFFDGEMKEVTHNK